MRYRGTDLWRNGVGLTAILSVLFAACSSDEQSLAGPEVTYSVRDSSGVRIVESSEEALGRLPWKVGEVPEFEIGNSESSPGGTFHRIAGIALVAGEEFAVLNGGSSEIRWYSSSGKYLRSFGGGGGGPGEFRSPVLVPGFCGDSLLVFDRTRRTFTRVAADGSGARVIPRDVRGLSGIPRADLGAQTLFISAGQTVCPENQGCDVPMFFGVLDLEEPKGDTLAVSSTRRLVWRNSVGRTLLDSPLSPRSMAAAGPQGPVLEGFPGFELWQFDDRGTLKAIYRLQTDRVEPKAAVDRYVNSLPDPATGREMFDLLGLPDVVPAFQALLVDEKGWYWAELFTPAHEGSGPWLVFDPQGEAQGTVVLPPGLQVHGIGENFILGSWQDELGVESVRRYSLDRGNQ